MVEEVTFALRTGCQRDRLPQEYSDDRTVHRHHDLDVAARGAVLGSQAFVDQPRDRRTMAGRVAVAATDDRFNLAPDTPSRAVVGSAIPAS